MDYSLESSLTYESAEEYSEDESSWTGYFASSVDDDGNDDDDDSITSDACSGPSLYACYDDDDGHDIGHAMHDDVPCNGQAFKKSCVGGGDEEPLTNGECSAFSASSDVVCKCSEAMVRETVVASESSSKNLCQK